jgi:hypothetical protein
MTSTLPTINFNNPNVDGIGNVLYITGERRFYEVLSTNANPSLWTFEPYRGQTVASNTVLLNPTLFSSSATDIGQLGNNNGGLPVTNGGVNVVGALNLLDNGNEDAGHGLVFWSKYRSPMLPQWVITDSGWEHPSRGQGAVTTNYPTLSFYSMYSNGASAFLTFTTNSAGAVSTYFGGNPFASHNQSANVLIAAPHTGNNDSLQIDGSLVVRGKVKIDAQADLTSPIMTLIIRDANTSNNSMRVVLVDDGGVFYTNNVFRFRGAAVDGVTPQFEFINSDNVTVGAFHDRVDNFFTAGNPAHTNNAYLRSYGGSLSQSGILLRSGAKQWQLAHDGAGSFAAANSFVIRDGDNGTVYVSITKSTAQNVGGGLWTIYSNVTALGTITAARYNLSGGGSVVTNGASPTFGTVTASNLTVSDTATISNLTVGVEAVAAVTNGEAVTVFGGLLLTYGEQSMPAFTPSLPLSFHWYDGGENRFRSDLIINPTNGTLELVNLSDIQIVATSAATNEFTKPNYFLEAYRGLTKIDSNLFATIGDLERATNDTARLAFTNALARLAQLDGATNATARLAFTNSLALLAQLDGATNETARLAFTNSLALLAQLDGSTNATARLAFTNSLALLAQLDGATNATARLAFTNSLALLAQLDGSTNETARLAFTNNLVQKGTTVVALGITSNTAASVAWTPAANVWTNSAGANTLHTATNASGSRLTFYWDYSVTALSTNTAVGFVITNSLTGFTMPYLITGASGVVMQGTIRTPCSPGAHVAWSNVWTAASGNTSSVSAVKAVVE